MRILFLGAYKSPKFRSAYGESSDSDLGGQRKMGLVVRALLRAGHALEIISSAISLRNGWGLQRPGVDDLRFPEGNVRVHHPTTWQRKPFGGFAMAILGPRLAHRVGKDFRPDVTFAYNTLLPEALGVLYLKRLLARPFVIEVDDMPGVRNSRWSLRSFLNQAPWNRILKGASAFVVVNGAIAAKLPNDGRPVFVLPGLIEDRLIDGALRRSPPFSREPHRVLYAGALTTDRGASLLLEAFPHFPAACQLRIAGAGPLAERFEALARQASSRCVFRGLLGPQELAEELLSADVVVNTPERLSQRDGVFPFKMMEYLASGALVLSPPLAPLPGCNLDWCTVWNGAPSHLAQLLAQAPAHYQRFRASIGEAAQWARDNFSLAAAAQSLKGLIDVAAAQPLSGKDAAKA